MSDRQWRPLMEDEPRPARAFGGGGGGDGGDGGGGP